MRASGPTSVRTRSRSSSSSPPSNRSWLAKVHHSDRLELELRAELRVRKNWKAGRGRVQESANRRPQLSRTYEDRLDPLHLRGFGFARYGERELLGGLGIECEIRTGVARAQRFRQRVLDERIEREDP